MRSRVLAPAIVLVAGFFFFAAPAHATPTDSISITNPSGSAQTNYPLQFGRPFIDNEIADYPQVEVNGTPITTQADVKNRYPDGSVEFAIISVLVPSIPTTGTTTLTFQNQASGDNTALTQSDMLSSDYDFDADIGISTTTGASATTSARTMLENGDYTYWTSGPVATTILLADDSTNRAYDMGFDANKSLRPRFYATFWPTIDKVQVRYVGEDSLDTTWEDMEYNLTLTIGSTSPSTVYTQSNVIQQFLTNWTKEYWIGGQPQQEIDIDYNLPYLEATNYFPDFDTSLSVPTSKITSEYTNWTNSSHTNLYDQGMWTPYMPTTGGRCDIGLINCWYMQWLYTGDWRSRAVALGQADLASAWSLNEREGDSNKKIDASQTVSGLGLPLSRYAYLNKYFPDNDGDYSQIGNQSSHTLPNANDWVAQNAHTPDPWFVPYVLTGDYYYLEEEQNWAAAQALMYNPGYSGNGTGAGISDEVRGDAWVLRNRANAELITPDSEATLKQFYSSMTNDALAFFEGWASIDDPNYDSTQIYEAGQSEHALGSDPLHFINCQDLSYTDGTFCGASVFEHSYFLIVLGSMIERGFTAAEPLMNWMQYVLTGQINSAGYDNYNLGAYWIAVQDQSDAWLATWADVQAVNSAHQDETALGHNVMSTTTTQWDSGNAYPVWATGAASFTTSYDDSAAYDWLDTNVRQASLTSAGDPTTGNDANSLASYYNGTADELDWDILPRLTVTNTLPPPVSTKFKLNDTVEVGTTTAARATPSLSGTLVATEATSSLGTIATTTAVYADGHNWWLVDYQDDNDGYSVEDDLDYIGSGPSVTLSASPSTIDLGASTTLSWNSLNTASCSGQNFTGSGTSGSATVHPTTTTTYTIDCTGSPSGSASANATVYVNDATPPIISAIATSTARTTATITWTTDELATSTIYYGTTSSYGTASSSDTLTTSHSISLTGLSAGTTYHFQVASADSSGNLATSSDQTFTTGTLACGFGADSGEGYCRGYLTSGSSWTVPSDWNSSNNAIEAIGAGGNGSASQFNTAGGNGGGGGAYAKITDLALTPETSVSYHVAPGGDGGATDTYFNGVASSTASLAAASGVNGLASTTASSTAQGGSASNSIGTTKYSGGSGGPGLGTIRDGGGGGGGSAGPLGAGQIGAATTHSDGSGGSGGGGSDGGSSTAGSSGSGSSGGAGGAGASGSGGGSGGTSSSAAGIASSGGGGGGGGTNGCSGNNAASAGSIDNAWDATHGAGGGGGGGTGSTCQSGGGAGGAGGTYGGGGGGAGDGTTGSASGYTLGGTGGSGLIVITYTPADTAPIISSIASSTASTTATITWTTNQEATSTVYYGTTSSYGMASSSDALMTSHSIMLTGLATSTLYHFQIASANSSGDLATSSDETFTTSSGADTTAPTASTTAPTSGQVVHGSSVTLSANATDDTAVAGVTFYINGIKIGNEVTSGSGNSYSTTWDSTATSSGSHIFFAVARDTANNYATSSSITFTVDNTPPALSAISSGTPGQTSASITWTTDEAASSTVYYGTSTGYGSASSSAAFVTSHLIHLTGLSAGTTYHYEIASADASGNLATSSDGTFTTASGSSGGCDFGTDIGGGACQGFLTATDSGTWTVPADWNNDDFTIEALGPGGNGGNGGSQNVGFMHPTLTDSGGGGGGGGDYAAISDTGGYSFTPGAPVNVNIDVGGSEDDTWLADDSDTTILEAAAGGNAGGTFGGLGGTDQFGSSVGDLVSAGADGGTQWSEADDSYSGTEVGGGGGGAGGPDGPGINDGSNNALSSGDGNEGPGTASNNGSAHVWDDTHQTGDGGAGADSVTPPNDGGNYGGGGGGGEYDQGDDAYADGALGGDGLIVITYASTGGGGGSDTTPPSVALTAPIENETTSGTMTLSADAADDTAVAGVTFYINGTQIGSEVTSPPYSVSYDTTATSSGSHIAFAVARDTSDNYATSTSVSFTIDNSVPDTTPPAISDLSSGSPGTTNATITWTTDEPATSQINYGTTSGYGSSTSLDSNLVTSHSVALSNLSPGTTYHFEALSADASSNLATSSDETFTTASQSSGGGGGGGGGSKGGSGGGSTVVSTLPANASVADLEALLATLTAQVQALMTQVNGAGAPPSATSAGAPSRDLTIGSTGADVTALQTWLIGKGYSIPAGATGYFGSETQSALARFQTAEHISPAVGYFGPVTRSLVNQIIAGTATASAPPPANSVPSAAPAPSPVSTAPTATPVTPTAKHAFGSRPLSLGMSGTDVAYLQQFLATIPGIYPAKGADTSGYFGTATEQAVSRFQTRYGVTSDPSALGSVGPKTFAEIAALGG